ncbi:hypothetical protein NEOLEDRAFT_627324 [Neolentinus lepideus HHB14362 ss-1]|uniref:Uncharacterized protein n=1 Tax=Neolentinus lepideus HHB14362 ss-1 TaxID=1314782 RepID=A0A165QQK3_9AGAM|nr:hypothetical protein NEOLEDRAFT_627324 [Neolentinus lepideus HHB14362 ss-1]
MSVTLVIPMNLRNSGSHGFPPPDYNAADHLGAPGRPEDLGIRMGDFLQALFEQTLHVLETEIRRDVAKTVAEQFREYMTAEMTRKKHGASRIKFYGAVVKRAKESPESRGPSSSTSDVYAPLQAFQKLADLLRSLEPQESSSAPLVILEFDEAQLLTESMRYELRRVLRTYSKLSLFSLFLTTTGDIEPLFSPFLSTRSKIKALVSTRSTSSRVSAFGFEFIHPFTNVGFDHLAIKVSLKQDIPTVERITSIEHLCHCGRPLWVAGMTVVMTTSNPRWPSLPLTSSSVELITRGAGRTFRQLRYWLAWPSDYQSNS